MDMVDVDSSNLAAIGFDGNEIHVRFKSGQTFAYTDPTDEDADQRFDMKDMFEDFALADSKGQFFAGHIKPFLTARRV